MWQGANVKRRPSVRTDDTETVEAALNRLLRCYRAAMDCLASWHASNSRCSSSSSSRSKSSHTTATTTTTTSGSTGANATTTTTLLEGTTATDTAAATNETTSIRASATSKRDIPVDVLLTVGRAARTTLASVLDDPLIAVHCPQWTVLIEERQAQSEAGDNASTPAGTVPRLQRRSAVQLTSAGHKETVRQLAYLSLVNMGDLLLSGIPQLSNNSNDDDDGGAHTTTLSPQASQQLLLDRGVVRCHPSISQHCTTTTTTSCWEESIGNDATTMTTTQPEDTLLSVRFAVVAYLDASSLDGSDPTIWLKLACAARRLGRLQSQQQQRQYPEQPLQPKPYRRLQQHALEHAVAARPRHEPPNRTAVQALREFRSEPPLVMYHAMEASSLTTRTPTTVLLELTRYSWSVFGRMLLRACREGSLFATPTTTPNRTTTTTMAASRNDPPLLASPNVKVRLSPILILPIHTLAMVCSYLETNQIWKFEATCRAMSSSVLSARALLDNNSERQHRWMEQQAKQQQQQQTPASPLPRNYPLSPPPSNTKMNTTIMSRTDGRDMSPSSANTPFDTEMTMEPDNSHSNDDTTTAANKSNNKNRSDSVNKGEDGEDQGRTHKRISKRVRSQIITSGKRTERSSRRNSTEFCLLACTIGCTVCDSSYRTILESNAFVKENHAKNASESSSSMALVGDRGSTTADDALDRLKVSSLSRFVEQCSTLESISPVACLFRFVAHASLHVAEVYASDQSGAQIMSTSLLDCLSFMTRRTRLSDTMISCWMLSNRKIPRGSKLTRIDIYAIDLLHAELRFKRCDGEELVSSNFDGDASFVSTVIPYLASLSEDDVVPNATDTVRETWRRLRVRSLWLAANFYFWRGRLCSIVGESREAEQNGLELLERTRASLNPTKGNESGVLVRTPHLVSPRRKGLHWKELSTLTLSNFSDEIQASSIVLIAKEQFLKATAKFSDATANQLLQKDDCTAFQTIGMSLLERYSSSPDSEDAKHSELVDDFLSVHSEHIMSTTFEDRRNHDPDTPTVYDWFNGVLPSELVTTARPLLHLSSPCTLSILTTCLQTNKEHVESIVQLVTRLILTITDFSDQITSRLCSLNAASRKDDQSSDSFSESDDDNESLEEGEEGEFGRSNGERSHSADKAKLLQYATTMQLLLDKIRSLALRETNTTRQSLFSSDEFKLMLHRVLSYSALWFQTGGTNFKSEAEDLGIFLSTQALFKVVADSVDGKVERSLTKIYLFGMMHIVVTQKQILSLFSMSKPNSRGRSERLKTTRKRADLVAAVCCDIGLLLSHNLVRVDGTIMTRSDLFAGDDASADAKDTSAIVLFANSLIWLWKAAVLTDGNAPDKNGARGSHLASYLDRFGRDRLRVPLATSIVAFCGSTTSSECLFSTQSKQSEDHISLVEFYDSDESAVDWLADSEESQTYDESKKLEVLLRVCMQAIHCVSQVFVKIDEKEAVSFAHTENYVTDFGPCLPLVVSRVLNSFSYYLLTLFGDKDEDKEKLIWCDYTEGTRSIGQLLDTALYKAYKYLHGFTLTNGVDLKDATTSNSATPKTVYLPENKEAGAMLYRCIMRAYSQGRKYPPKVALETVLASLPKLEESHKSLTIRRYIFSCDLDNINTSSLVALVQKKLDSRVGLKDIDQLVSSISDEKNDALGECDDESLIVRRGLSKLIAQGPLPQYQDSGDENDNRSSSFTAEEELSRKFFAIIDNLCFGNSRNCESWFKASQCLSMKADIVADRVGLTKGFARNQKYSVTERKAFAEGSLAFSELLDEQGHQQSLHDEGWVQSIGPSLSPFARHSWSSFRDLRVCALEIQASFEDSSLMIDGDEQVADYGRKIGDEIEHLYLTNDLAKWQQAWGGLFVSSLRKAAHRCLFIALHTSYRLKEEGCENDLLISEITETIGVSLYSELMGSQVYGYPMKEMSLLRKREIAEASFVCFERAAAVAGSSERESDEKERVVWDLLFMMGKCHEKIASTVKREKFLAKEECTPSIQVRTYERELKLALDFYAKSIAKAKEEDESGGFIAEQNGGSAHGVVEIVYRLHATRLKSLIEAVDRREDERAFAEEEGLRIAESHWYAVPRESEADLTVRERVWRVLADIVDALAKCRLDNTYFHRSVYRHAQALMWAPVLYDPVKGRVQGSLGNVSITWSNKIRGLNYATNSASSAMPIIGSLFEKKRPQLVAVWVTGDGTTSTLQTINNSVRKYDSLRGKYISAYIDSLRLCERRKELDTFLRWAWTAKRDLPSYFAASALTEGGRPPYPHTAESILLKNRVLSSIHFLSTVKRETNSALAAVVLQDISNYGKKTESSNTSTKTMETQLKLAYACYLRLNCDFAELKKSRAWKFNRSTGAKNVVEAFTTAYMNVAKVNPLSEAKADWSGQSQLAILLKSAIDDCKKRFPTLSGSFSFSKARAPAKKKAQSTTAGIKRKADASHEVKKTFEVAVPEGLSPGDTFISSIQVGDTLKAIRLTVPNEAASTLRFSFQVPADGSEGDENKKSRSDAQQKPEGE